MKKFIKENKVLIIMWLIFETVAITLFVSTGNIFYLFNFTYIGTCIAVGLFLMGHKKKYARNFVQFGVGLYMLIYLGIICRENMQIEGFWYYLFLKKLGWIRYVVFLLSLSFVASLFIFKVDNLENIMFGAFIIGNVIYYALGILLAFIFKDNRAFCKYICPITVFLKPASYYSYIRVRCDHTKCINCKKCVRNCPMNVDMLDDSRKRKNGTECILCTKCINECPKNALRLDK